MVTGRGKWRGDSLKKGVPTVVDVAGLAVHGKRCANGLAAKGFIHALHAQTDTQNRNLAGQGGYHRGGNTGKLRRLGAGAYQDIIRGCLFNVGDGNPITAMHGDIKVEHGKQLHQVVGEGIIIIDDE